MLEIEKYSTERRHEEIVLGKRKSDVRKDRRRTHKSPPSSLYYWKKSGAETRYLERDGI